MARAVAVLILLTLFTALSAHAQYHYYQAPAVTMKHVTSTPYPCMEDWNKVCEKDSDCCSGECLTFFCKVVGLDVTTPSRKRRPKITINISK